MGFCILQHRFLIVPDDAENVDLSSYSHAIRHPNVTELTIEEYDKTLTISRGNNGTLNATKVFLWPSPNKSLRISMTGLHCDAVIFVVPKLASLQRQKSDI